MSGPGRNDPCPCGGGKKYKKCCGGAGASAPPAAPMPVDPAIKALEDDVRAGDLDAARTLGLNYILARNVPQNLKRGVELVERAARGGDGEAAFVTAALAAAGAGRTPSWKAAFDRLQRAAELGSTRARQELGALAAGPDAASSPSEDWAELRGQIDMEAWRAAPRPQTLSPSPKIVALEKFVTPEACACLQAQTSPHMQRATIYDRETGGDAVDNRRTNSHCDLNVDVAGPLTFVLRERIAAVTGRPQAAMEAPKVLHYAPGETFAEHYDFLDPTEPGYQQELSLRGQREVTFLIYLNDDYEGGETTFPRLSLSHKGDAGDAVLFVNASPQGEPDRRTLHIGAPPTTGEKWLFSQWIRSLPAA